MNATTLKLSLSASLLTLAACNPTSNQDTEPALTEGTVLTMPTEDALPNTQNVIFKLVDNAAADLYLDTGHLRTGLSAIDDILSVHASIGGRMLAENGGLEHPLSRTGVVPVDGDLEDVADALEALPQVEWAEPVHHVYALGTPDDPFFDHQWNLSTLGLTTVWDDHDGAGAVVAVIDTGVSTNGADGFSNLTAGYDFVDDDDDASDANGHGTHVAGTIAQATNNGTGTAGVAPGATIMPIRVLGADGSGTSVDVAAGIYWAVDNGAHIINMSLGSAANSTAIAMACEYAADNNVLVIAASGNDGARDAVSYPAANSGTLAVGATDLNGEVTYYSNQGDELDITAPGGDTSADEDHDGFPDGIVQETVYGGTWDYYSFMGTSMAAPHVAGVAALLWGSGVTDRDELIDALLDTADDQGTEGRDNTYGHGIVDPIAAIGYEAPEVEDLEITSLDAEAVSFRRGLVGLETNQPTTAMMSFTAGNGTEVNHIRPMAGERHHFLVRGFPGETLELVVTVEASDGSVETQTVELTFPTP